MCVTHGSTLGPKTTWTEEALGLKAAAEAGSSCGGIEYIFKFLVAGKTKQIRGRFLCN
jgi:hypothetical protein